MTVFSEVADRVWVGRLDWYDVNVTVVGGSDGLLVADSWASAASARGLLEEIGGLGGPVRWLVNTHDHFDHIFGNSAFAEAGAQLIAHEDVLRTLPDHAAAVQRQAALDLEDPSADPRLRELVETQVALPTRTFSSVTVVDLGDRAVELVHPGRGHTSGDCVVRVDDVDVLVAGDLVEEAGDGVPAFGEDSWPLDWPLTLDVVLQLATPATVVVPGHGRPVDRAFVEEQRNDIGMMAETIRELAGRGVPVDQAADAGDWPWPVERLGEAISGARTSSSRSRSGACPWCEPSTVTRATPGEAAPQALVSCLPCPGAQRPLRHRRPLRRLARPPQRARRRDASSPGPGRRGGDDRLVRRDRGDRP